MLIKPLAAILLTLTALNSLDALAGNLASRVNQARQRCLKPRQNGLTVEFKNHLRVWFSIIVPALPSGPLPYLSRHR